MFWRRKVRERGVLDFSVCCLQKAQGLSFSFAVSWVFFVVCSGFLLLCFFFFLGQGTSDRFHQGWIYGVFFPFILDKLYQLNALVFKIVWIGEIIFCDFFSLPILRELNRHFKMLSLINTYGTHTVNNSYFEHSRSYYF